MKLLHILLSMLGLGVLVSCKKSGYDTKDGSVFYKDDRMSEADKGSFEVLNDVFAKDKNQAYYRGISIEGSDGPSFSALDEHYGKDKQRAYYCDNYLDFKLFDTSRKNKIIPISNADPVTFQTISNEYARDKIRCYYKGKGFAVKDVLSFEPLDYEFGKDKITAYYQLTPIPKSVGDSFVVLSRNFAKDKQQVYYAWNVIDDPSSSGIGAIKQADPESFTVVGMYYTMDNAHAFYQNKPLPVADPTSFKQWDANTIQYAIDNSHIYFRESLIAGADRASFRLLADEYARIPEPFILKISH
ncbi:DKNYY domain-containing protein [Spirosoma telluris]|uniref:DKNYY domain-containing protein n=1 Tax=Spirosoma telluris TaxID=2183553 RepID=UPI002FC3CD4A